MRAKTSLLGALLLALGAMGLLGLAYFGMLSVRATNCVIVIGGVLIVIFRREISESSRRYAKWDGLLATLLLARFGAMRPWAAAIVGLTLAIVGAVGLVFDVG